MVIGMKTNSEINNHITKRFLSDDLLLFVY